MVWKRWSGSVRWQEDSWQPKSLMSRQPGSSLGQVPTPRGGPRSGKGSSGVRNFSYEMVADASSDMVGDGLVRALSGPGLLPRPPLPLPPHSNLSAVPAAPGCAHRSSLQAECRDPPPPGECQAARRGCSGPHRPAGHPVSPSLASASASVVAAAAAQPSPAQSA